MDQLKQEGLIEKLDMDGKGFITVEDIVRIINMEEGTFFRNRDLYLVFQRLNRNEMINAESISISTLINLLDGR